MKQGSMGIYKFQARHVRLWSPHALNDFNARMDASAYFCAITPGSMIRLVYVRLCGRIWIRQQGNFISEPMSRRIPILTGMPAGVVERDGGLLQAVRNVQYIGVSAMVVRHGNWGLIETVACIF
jgi:hypothetical protein